MNKFDHVREQSAIPENSGHHCHWTGCSAKVPPAMWGCKKHWFKLPLGIRNKIWASYRAGQEITKTPSRKYMDAAEEARLWIAENSK